MLIYLSISYFFIIRNKQVPVESTSIGQVNYFLKGLPFGRKGNQSVKLECTSLYYKCQEEESAPRIFKNLMLKHFF